MKELWELFIVFAKIGGFTFGGGYAMLPILQREVVENRNWATSEELIIMPSVSVHRVLLLLIPRHLSGISAKVLSAVLWRLSDVFSLHWSLS